MKQSPEIWNELLEISPLVAGILPSDGLYSLPEGYFANLAENLLIRVQTGHSEMLPSFLDQHDKISHFPIPGNYFESFPEKLMSLIRKNQAVSPGEELAGLSPLLRQIGKKTPFNVPIGYFNGLSDQVTAGLNANGISSSEEGSEIESLLINSLDKGNMYSTPPGYFDELPQLILNKVKEKPRQAKVLTLGRSRTFLKYAAAAIIAGGLLIGGAVFFEHPSVKPLVADAANPPLGTVSDQEILTYLEAQNVPLNDMNSLAAVDVSDNDAKDLLGDVSDAELQQYLNEHVSPKDLKDN
jgi:hypothetical protein